MASTNKTTNLSLSQFIATDKPSWLSDYNADMAKIDAGYGTAISDSASAVSGAASASAAAQAAQTTANSAETRSTNNATAIGQINEKLTFSLNSAIINNQNATGGYTNYFGNDLMGFFAGRLTLKATPGASTVQGSTTLVPLCSFVGNILTLPTSTITDNNISVGSSVTKITSGIEFYPVYLYFDGANTIIYAKVNTSSAIGNLDEMEFSCSFFNTNQIATIN